MTDKTYSYKEALQGAIKYFNGDELAGKVWVDKYALRDSKENLLEINPEEMHWRIANELARVDKKKFKKSLTANDYFSYLQGFKKIVLQGGPMFGLGNKYHYSTLSNCYVIESPLDS